MSKNLPEITIYTDGACSPNPGPGGWAAILLRPGAAKPQELCGAQGATTNNQMELRAVLEALKSLPEPHRITLYTDSQYLRRGITEWLPQWQARGWRTSDKSEVKNQELWQALAAETSRHTVAWKWVKGHAGHRWNERADQLACSMLPAAPALPLQEADAIHIFTAASCRGAYGPGGWGAVLRYGDILKKMSGHDPDTSANRMHLTAALRGLQAVKKPLPIHLYTTADYLHEGITKWVKGWQSRGWQTKEGKPVTHQDLWQTLTSAAADYKITWHLVSKEKLPDLMTEAKALAGEAARGRRPSSNYSHDGAED
jgi:ribonuclease HI